MDPSISDGVFFSGSSSVLSVPSSPLCHLKSEAMPPVPMSADVFPMADDVMEGGVMVDEDVVHETVSLSQRCSVEAVGM